MSWRGAVAVSAPAPRSAVATLRATAPATPAAPVAVHCGRDVVLFIEDLHCFENWYRRSYVLTDIFYNLVPAVVKVTGQVIWHIRC